MYEYTIVKRAKLVDTVRAVNALIKEGWMPEGGIAVGTQQPSGQIVHAAHFYAQAMLKRVRNNPVPLSDLVSVDLEPQTAIMKKPSAHNADHD